MNFKEFRKRVEEAGLKARDCGGGHWRIDGGNFSVNWYPNSKRRTIYVNGFGAVVSTSGGFEKALQMALEPPIQRVLPKPLQAQRRADYVDFKRKALVRDPRCYLCCVRLTYHTATADHVIPLCKGGTNASDNLRLACQKCNRMKGDKYLIELEAEQASGTGSE